MQVGTILEGSLKQVLPQALQFGNESGEYWLVKPEPALILGKGKSFSFFITHQDHENQWWGSLKIPELGINEVDFLPIVRKVPEGYYLDWGMPQELFCPGLSAVSGVHTGMVVPIRLIRDEEQNRLIASMRWKKDTLPAGEEYFKGRKVDILVMEPAEKGFVVLVDHFYLGMVYDNQTFIPLKTGQKHSGYVNKLREDGRLDILIQKPGYRETDQAADRILTKLKQSGKLKLGDKSPADLIYSELGMSKKVFKKAIGQLYKQKRIDMNEHAVWLTEEGD